MHLPYIYKLCIFVQLFALPGLIQFHYYTIKELFAIWIGFYFSTFYYYYFSSLLLAFLTLVENCLLAEGNNKNAWVEKYQLNCRRAQFRKKMKWKMRSSWKYHRIEDIKFYCLIAWLIVLLLTVILLLLYE